ncbi:MAG: hypothetical protein ACSLE9_16965 [Burkholderiaceae bacterium]
MPGAGIVAAAAADGTRLGAGPTGAGTAAGAAAVGRPGAGTGRIGSSDTLLQALNANPANPASGHRPISRLPLDDRILRS